MWVSWIEIPLTCSFCFLHNFPPSAPVLLPTPTIGSPWKVEKTWKSYFDCKDFVGAQLKTSGSEMPVEFRLSKAARISLWYAGLRKDGKKQLNARQFIAFISHWNMIYSLSPEQQNLQDQIMIKRIYYHASNKADAGQGACLVPLAVDLNRSSRTRESQLAAKSWGRWWCKQ